MTASLSVRAGHYFAAGLLMMHAVPDVSAQGDGGGREKDAVFHPINLREFFSVPFSHHRVDHSWAVPPRGTHELDGIPFIIEGRVEVTGMGAARDGSFFPTRVAGIPMRVSGQKMHFLFGAGYDAKEGTPIAEFVLHYANGQKRSLRIAYGVHTRNWYEERSEITAELSDPNAGIAWFGYRGDTGFHPTLRLFRATFENPLPEGQIESMDILSLFSRATPVLVAVTVEEQLSGSSSTSAKDAAGNGPDATPGKMEAPPYRRELLARTVEGAGGHPLTNATVQAFATDDSRTFFFGAYPSDKDGQAIVDYPPGQLRAVILVASAPDRAPRVMKLDVTEEGFFPPEITLQLEKGTRIGGVVQDVAGAPVTGAQVVVAGRLPADLPSARQTEFDAVQTDAKGMWSTHCVSENAGELSIAVEHPDYQTGSFEYAPGGTTRDELLAGKVLFALEPGFAVEGVVTERNQEPVPGATVLWGKPDLAWTNRFVRTDASGRFKFTLRGSDVAMAAVFADGFAPRLMQIRPSARLPKLHINLNKATSLKGQVLDPTGLPIAGASVVAAQWRETRCLNWAAQTDVNGRFEWSSPPEGPVVYTISKPGFKHLRKEALTAGEQEVTIRLQPGLLKPEKRPPLGL